MMRVLEGKLVDSGIKVGIVAARFNEFIVSKLVAGAKDGLVRHDVSEENIDLAWVPGAFEIPLIASKMAKSGKYDAVICLGAVIRGATSHYDYVCSEVSKDAFIEQGKNLRGKAIRSGSDRKSDDIRMRQRFQIHRT